MNCSLSVSEAHQWALSWLLQAELLTDRRQRTCTPAVVWSIVLRAAAHLTSVFATCRDFANAPSPQAVFDALEAGLPRTLSVLEKRLHQALTDHCHRHLRRRSWQVAIDWHLVPYYGEPQRSRNELFRYKMQRGTTHFHAYASACVVQHGHRYTLAFTWVRRHESVITVLRRLLARIGEMSVKIKVLLLDRFFFKTPVMALLQQEQVPFLMPVVASGRRPKRKNSRAAKKGWRWFKRQQAGWHRHTMKNKQAAAEFRVCVAYRSYFNRKKQCRGQQKLLFAAWRVRGTPTEIRERYRKRFGIESSFRQLRQARIYTCTRNPRLRLTFIGVALLLRNLWVWIHATLLATGRGPTAILHLERLRFRQLLAWIAQSVAAELHDGSTPSVRLEG